MGLFLCEGCVKKGSDSPLRMVGQKKEFLPQPPKGCPRCGAKPIEWVKLEDKKGIKIAPQAIGGRKCIKCKILVDDGYVPPKHLCIPDPPYGIRSQYMIRVNEIVKIFTRPDDQLLKSRCTRVCTMLAMLHCQAKTIVDSIWAGGSNDKERISFLNNNLVTLQRKFTPGGDCLSQHYVDDLVSHPRKYLGYFKEGWELLGKVYPKSKIGPRRATLITEVLDHDKGYPQVLTSLRICAAMLR